MQQTEITLNSRQRGFHLITGEILSKLPNLPTIGILNLFIKHTSAGLTINENADSTVREDFESIFNKLIPESQDYYTHTQEGPDDMPAHVKASLIGTSLSIPITNAQLNLGTWQGIYLCEFRNHGGSRKIVATLID
jgi:secondary thiamine-phosphate synthase enzyme